MVKNNCKKAMMMKNRIRLLTTAVVLALGCPAATVETDRTWYLAGEAMTVSVTDDDALIAYAELCAAVHRHFGDFHVVEEHFARIGLDDAHYHVEGGGFAGTVGAEKSNDFALADADAHLFHYGARAVYFDYVFGAELHVLIC